MNQNLERWNRTGGKPRRINLPPHDLTKLEDNFKLLTVRARMGLPPPLGLEQAPDHPICPELAWWHAFACEGRCALGGEPLFDGRGTRHSIREGDVHDLDFTRYL